MQALSASRVQAYLLCPLKYRFEHVDRLPKPWRAAALAFGTSIHAAIEWFHRELLAGRTVTLEAVLKMFDADWYAQNIEPLVFGQSESKSSLAEKGRAMLERYMEARASHVPARVEERFEIPLVDPKTGEDLGFVVHGVIDLVEEDGTVVDFKTAARTPDLGGVGRHLQLSMYALAVFIRSRSIPKLRLDVLVKTKVPRLDRYETLRSLDDLAWTARLFEGVGQAIAAERFFPNPSWLCAECEYFAHCQAWRGNALRRHEAIEAVP
jgi:putative RecB family exonuclease